MDGDIHTLDGAGRARALSIRDGLVQSVGSFEAVAEHKGRSTRIVDVGGATIVPGLILSSLPKDATGLLDWQEIDLSRAAGDRDAYLSQAISPPLFSSPVFVRSAGAADAEDNLDLLAALETLFPGVPIAVAFEGTCSGLANRAMFRIVNGPDFARTASAVPFVTDIRAFLDAYASQAAHSIPSIANDLKRTVVEARCGGYTTIVDRALGALRGRDEVEAAVSLFSTHRHMRMRSAAHWKLRGEWDGRLPPQIRPDIMTVDAALVNGNQSAADLLTEAELLIAAGWSVVFSANGAGELETVMEVCQTLRATRHEQVFYVKLGFHAEETDMDRLRRSGIAFSVLPTPATVKPLLSAGVEGDRLGLPATILDMTRQAAFQCGIDGVTGSITRGKYADFTVLEGTVGETEIFKVAGTWVDGIPAS